MSLVQFIGQATCNALTLSATCYNPNFAITTGIFVLMVFCLAAGAFVASNRA